MMDIDDILREKSVNDDVFSPNYTSVLTRLLSTDHRSNAFDVRDDIICDSHIQETGTKKIKEDLVRCIWYGGHYDGNNLYTEDGVRLEVINPGGWNVEGGPDFHHCEILFADGGLKKGDVEVHVYGADWKRHGHHLQKSYNNVCLHVSMWNDKGDEFVYNENGQPVHQLILNKYLNADIDELFETININDYPKSVKTNETPCRKGFSGKGINRDRIGAFLDLAGDERITFKAAELEKSVDKSTFEQTLYESIMEALGYKNNRNQFLKLSTILKYEDIKAVIPLDIERDEMVLYAQAALLGMAGLLPYQLDERLKKRPDGETDKYVKRIESIWLSEIEPALRDFPMDGNLWQFSKTRPANFPVRRLAAMGHLIVVTIKNDGMIKYFLSVFERAESVEDEKKRFCEISKGLESLFLQITDDYWSYYYSFNGKRLARPERLIGKDRTLAILINVLIPIFLIYARRNVDVEFEKMLHLLFRRYPRQASNNVTRFMIDMIFGNEKEANKIINNVRRQMGLHQIFRDFCDSDNFLCNKCPLYLMFNN